MRTARVLLVAAVATATALVPSQALADCARPTAPYLLELAAEGGRSVFVGSVVEGGNTHVARMEVDQVWSGPDLAPVVRVRTGPEQLPWPLSRVMVRVSSVDADLMLGERYLVATDGDVATDLCSSMAVTAEVLAQAPADARPPTADGLSGHALGLFDTALGATLLTAVLGIAAMVWSGRRLDRRSPMDAYPPGRRAVRGAVIGAVIGVVGAGIAELATTATRQLYPTDVGIAGFALVFGAPASVLVGALCWWRARPASGVTRLMLTAAPVVVVGAAQVALQWSSQ